MRGALVKGRAGAGGQEQGASAPGLVLAELCSSRPERGDELVQLSTCVSVSKGKWIDGVSLHEKGGCPPLQSIGPA